MSIVERERVETEVAPVTTKEVLHRAADLLEEFEWCQADIGRDADGRKIYAYQFSERRPQAFCAVGAICQAAIDLGLNYRDFYNQYHSDDSGWPMWNDANGRTKAEVVTRLRDAANAL